MFLLIYTVPPPLVVVERFPNASVELFTTDSLSLTCTYTVSKAINSRISATVTWTGSASLSDFPRVTHVGSGVDFTSLKSSDTAIYTCCVLLISATSGVINSKKVCVSLPIVICKQLYINH